jgi:hypothetical protein
MANDIKHLVLRKLKKLKQRAIALIILSEKKKVRHKEKYGHTQYIEPREV